MVCVMDATTGAILGRVKVDSVPRGIALVENQRGALTGAWVLNAVANTVSVLDLSDLTDPKVKALVYVAAFAPDIGRSTGDQVAAHPAPPGLGGVTDQGGGHLMMSVESWIRLRAGR